MAIVSFPMTLAPATRVSALSFRLRSEEREEKRGAIPITYLFCQGRGKKKGEKKKNESSTGAAGRVSVEREVHLIPRREERVLFLLREGKRRKNAVGSPN